MPLFETAFEHFAAALEVTPGTAIAAPTHFFPFRGMITPNVVRSQRTVSDGTLENFISSRKVSEDSSWTGTASLDTYNAPFLFNLLVKSVTAPTTPTNGVLTRLWSFLPIVTSDVQKSATLFWGDNNVQAFRTAFNYADSFTITADATGDDVAQITMSGRGQAMEKIADPTLPTQLTGHELPPVNMDLWMDTGATAIGTTPITGRLLFAELSATLTRSYKRVAAGPTATGVWTVTGVGKRNATCRLRFEVPDMTQFDLVQGGTVVKCRVRLNGQLIESVTPAYYQYVQWDIYGALGDPAWGENAGTNRTLDVTITSEKNVTAGHSWALYVQNDRTTL